MSRRADMDRLLSESKDPVDKWFKVIQDAARSLRKKMSKEGKYMGKMDIDDILLAVKMIKPLYRQTLKAAMRKR